MHSRRPVIGIHPLIAFIFMFLLVYVMTDQWLAGLMIGLVGTLIEWVLSGVMS